MFSSDRLSFSCEGNHFAWCTTSGDLIIRDISSSVKQKFVFNTNECGACSCLIWVNCKQKIRNPRKAKLLKRSDLPFDNAFLVLGTEKGTILVFNFITNTPTSLENGHSDKVNDMCWNSTTELLYSCSNDCSVAVWDLATYKIKLKWKASDDPLSSICVIDNNILSTATNCTIHWWNVKKQTVVKKFSAHSTEILKLLPVNDENNSSNCQYILSAAAGERKINAWNINENYKNPVATFILEDEPLHMELSKFEIDKPLLLFVLTKKGSLHIFEHVFNGKKENNLLPKTTIKLSCKGGVDSKLHPIPIISIRHTQDLESCIIAYGSPSEPIFEHLNIVNSPKEMTFMKEKCDICCQENKSKLKDNCKLNGRISSAENLSLQLTPESCQKSYRKREFSCIENEPQSSSITKAQKAFSDCQQTIYKSFENVRNTCSSDEEEHHNTDYDSFICSKEETVCESDNVLSCLLRGLRTRNKILVYAALECNDDARIKETLKYLPSQNVKLFLEYLHQRLKDQRYVPSARKWMKELLGIHLHYFISSNDMTDILNPLKEFIESKRPTETISKISTIQGLLSMHHFQNASSEESDSEDNSVMEC